MPKGTIGPRIPIRSSDDQCDVASLRRTDLDEVQLTVYGGRRTLDPVEALALARALTDMAHKIQRGNMTAEDVAKETRERR